MAWAFCKLVGLITEIIYFIVVSHCECSVNSVIIISEAQKDIVYLNRRKSASSDIFSPILKILDSFACEYSFYTGYVMMTTLSQYLHSILVLLSMKLVVSKRCCR